MSSPKRILIVDDDERARLLMKAMVETLGHESECARDGFEALAMVRLGFDLVLLDVVMPGMDGFEVTQAIRQDEEFHDLPILIVTALLNKEDRIRAIKMGANDFITKPVDTMELSVRMSLHLKMKEAQDEIKRNRAELEEMLDKRTSTLRRALEELADAKRKAHEAHLETIRRLAIVAEYKDKDTAAHIQRLGHYCAIIGRGLSLPPNEIEILYHASPMHDVGKLGIPDKNLLKPGKLDAEEWKIMKMHTVIGGKILGGSRSDLLQAGETIALCHHERWDGNGYPRGLAEEEIPVWGRICAVADVFDALSNPRPYKEAYSNDTVLAMMREERGRHFDPRVLDVFFGKMDEMAGVQKRYRDEPLFSSMAG